MLNKENTKKAEEVAAQLDSMFAAAYKLGKIYDKTRKEQHQADQRLESWEHPDAARDWHYKNDGITQREREQVRALYYANKKEWNKRIEMARAAVYKAEDKHRVARINFINYMNYFAAHLGDLIHPYWRAFVSRQGLHNVAEIINNRHPRKDSSAGACSVGIYNEGGELYENPNEPGQHLRIECHIYTGWACGITGKDSRIYQVNPGEVWHVAELPPVMTVKDYTKNKTRIEMEKKKIKKARDDLYRFAISSGLLGFVNIDD